MTTSESEDTVAIERAAIQEVIRLALSKAAKTFLEEGDFRVAIEMVAVWQAILPEDANPAEIEALAQANDTIGRLKQMAADIITETRGN
jgi:hypothetical protein